MRRIRDWSSVEQAKARTAFEVLLAEHRGVVVKVAYAYAYRHEERQDLIQEILLQLWSSYPSFDQTKRFSTWMYRVALNVAISWRRSERPESIAPEMIDRASVPEPEIDERREFLDRWLRGLGRLDRALVLLYLEDRSYAEISDVLGLSETNVATKISRLKQRLRDAFKGETDGA